MNMSTKIKLISEIISILVIVFGCSTVPEITPVSSVTEEVIDSTTSEREEVNPKALSYFMDAELMVMQGNIPRGILEYQDALKHDPHSTTIRVSLARAYIKIGKFKRAEEVLLETLETAPADKETRELLAHLYYIQNQMEKSEKEYQYLIRLYPDELDYFYMIAEIALRNGEPEKAQNIYRDIYKSHPTEERALIRAAELSTRRGDYQFAFMVYQELVKLFPNSTRYWRLYSELAIQTQNLAEVIYGLEKLIELSGGEPEVLEQLAIRYYESEETSKADSLFKILYEEDYKSLAVVYFLGQAALEQEQNVLAQKYAKECMELFPDERSGYTQLALTYIYQDNPLDAISVLLKARDILPDDFGIVYLLGRSYNMRGNYVLAKKSMLDALKINPDDRLAKHLLASIHSQLDEFEYSDSIYRDLIASDGSDGQALNNYSYTLAERGLDLEKALEIVQKALQLEPDNPAYLDTAGWIYFKMGKHQKAYDYITRSVDLEGNNAVVLEHLGDVISEMGDSEKASQFYKRAFELDEEKDSLKQKINE